MNLTTLTKYKTYAGISSTAQDTLLTQMIPQVSAAIAKFLRRDLELTTYKTWVDGSGVNFLRLPQYPITALYQVSAGSYAAATIENTSDAVQRAMVSFDGTNLTLVSIASGEVTTIELPVATYKSLATLKTAVELISGWEMDISLSDYENEPSSFLRPFYSQDATDSADLWLPDSTKIVRMDNAEDGIISLRNPVSTQSPYFPGSISPMNEDLGFPAGTTNIFVWYKAGYVLPTDNSDGTLPAGLHLLVQQIIREVVASRSINSTLQSESISGYSYSLRATKEDAVASAIESRKKELHRYQRKSI